jgi:SAM-dependent methyltransferase
MTNPVTSQESLEAVLKDEIIRMYQDVAENPQGEYHFFHGREAAELFGYDKAWLDRAPAGAVASFAGVGNPHLRSNVQVGETVVDLGSGAGLDAIIASWSVGPTGQVIGVDLNPAMCLKAQAHAAASGTRMECREG